MFACNGRNNKGLGLSEWHTTSDSLDCSGVPGRELAEFNHVLSMAYPFHTVECVPEGVRGNPPTSCSILMVNSHSGVLTVTAKQPRHGAILP